MLNSNLIDLLKTLSPKERKEFREYIVSPFFNKNKETVALYDYIKKFYSVNNELNSASEKALKKESVFAKLFGGKKYNDMIMRKLMFTLSKLCEDYIAYKNYKKDLITEGRHLLAELNDRKCDKLFDKVLRNINLNLGKENKQDELFYFDSFLMEKEKNNYKARRFLPDTDEEAVEYHSESQALTIFYLINILKRYCYLIAESGVSMVDYNKDFMEDITGLIEKNEYDKVPIISLYLNYIKMSLYEDDESYFYSLKSKLNENPGLFKREVAYDFYMILQNYCSVKSYEGKSEFNNELFDVYESMLANKIFSVSENGFISLVNFKNFVTVGVNLKKFDWVENFINEYTGKLPPEDRKNAFNYCMGIMYFSKGEFEKALSFAGKTTYEDVYYKMEIKVLTLKTYYELGLFNEAFDLAESFRHFLSNNKLIPAYIRDSNKNFIVLLNKLIRLNSKKDSFEIHKLKAKMLNVKYLMSRKWLSQKIETIEQTY